MTFATDIYTTVPTEKTAPQVRKPARSSIRTPKIDTVIDLLHLAMFLATAAIPLALLNAFI